MLNYKLCLYKLILLEQDTKSKFPNVNSATSGDKKDGGVVSDAVDWFGEGFKNALVSFGKWFVTGFFDVLSPFIIWGCRIVILWCIVTAFCTKDTKTLTTGFKAFLIYLVFLMIRSVVL